METQQNTHPSSSALTPETDALTREERCDRYRDLARAVIELAWRDARPESRSSDANREDARAFLFSESGDFWASLGSVNLAHLRRVIRESRLAR
ncbi:hypothetical protein FJZ36_19030 [Candidatus Poribacteria bacterium]|nr:hypothetical protein [Candidatus Poribacteria bacterium]